MNPYLEIESQEYTFIGKKSSLKGDFNFNSHTIITCEIEGTLRIGQSDSLLKLERESTFRGDIHCFDIQIDGEVTGNIYSQGKIRFGPTGKFKGYLTSEFLEIAPGAQVDMEAQSGLNK